MARLAPEISSKQVTIQVVRRSLLPPDPGESEARHTYSTVLTTRAAVKSAGSSQWASVDVDGTKVTHTFTIRFTRLSFDKRDRVRDVRGQLYQILTIDNVDLANREYRIQCALTGNESAEAAR